MYAYLCTGTHQQRTDIQRSTRFIRRNETLVQLHHLQNSFFETLRRKFRHQDATASGLQAGCILLQTEDTHFTVFATKSLQTLKRFLTVVQTSGSHVHRNGFLTANFQFAPLFVTIVNSHIVICLHISERQISPIKFFHISKY